MAISTNQKPTIYRNLYENTGPVSCRHKATMLNIMLMLIQDLANLVTVSGHCHDHNNVKLRRENGYQRLNCGLPVQQRVPDYGKALCKSPRDHSWRSNLLVTSLKWIKHAPSLASTCKQRSWARWRTELSNNCGSYGKLTRKDLIKYRHIATRLQYLQTILFIFRRGAILNLTSDDR